MDLAQVAVGQYRVITSPDKLPKSYWLYRKHALLVEEFDLSQTEQGLCFFGVSLTPNGFPELLVSQRYEPSVQGFDPGILIVPETGLVFIGAGERVLAYRLHPVPARLWIDQADIGFWGWAQHGDIVLMSAEVELAAWTVEGQKLWSTFVEPPWSYTVSDEEVTVDVMGKISRFSLRNGPKAG